MPTDFQNNTNYFKSIISGDSNASRLLITLILAFFAIAAIVNEDFNFQSYHVRRRHVAMELQQNLHGQQQILNGCANLYGGDPILIDSETAAVVICSDASISSRHLEVAGMYDGKNNDGITSVETGSETWVTLFTKENFQGESIVIRPRQSVSLQEFPLAHSDNANWAKVSRSIQVYRGAGVLLYEVTGPISPPSPYCAIFYLEDPLRTSEAIGLAACGDPEANSWDVTASIIQSFGFGTLSDFGMLRILF